MQLVRFSQVVVATCLVMLSTTLCRSQPLGLIETSDDAYNGYTLIRPSNYPTAFLIDNCGNLVHEWDLPGTGNTAKLREDGLLLISQPIDGDFLAPGIEGKVMLIDQDSRVVWSFELSNDTAQLHHDIAILPNGNLLVNAWVLRTEEDLIAAGRVPENAPGGNWSEGIYELEILPNNGYNIVWQWDAWDHLVQDTDPDLPNYGVISEHPERLDVNKGATEGGATTFLEKDWLHFNAIGYNPDLDQIALSSRFLSEFYIIDHSTTTQEARGSAGGRYGKGGDFLYRCCNPQNYNLGDADDQITYDQHATLWVPEGLPGAGNFMLFNNQVAFGYSSVLELELPQNADGSYNREPGQPYGYELVWDFGDGEEEDYFSRITSGWQRLPNGNTLIAQGAQGRVFEVDENDEIVWEFQNPYSTQGLLEQGDEINGNGIFRASRYSQSYPGLPDNLQPEGPLVTPAEVFGCEVGITTGLPLIEEQFLAYPNPVEDRLTILPQESMVGQQWVIYNALGQSKQEGTILADRLEIETWQWEPGVYLLQVGDQSPVRIVKMD